MKPITSAAPTAPTKSVVINIGCPTGLPPDYQWSEKAKADLRAAMQLIVDREAADALSGHRPPSEG